MDNYNYTATLLGLMEMTEIKLNEMNSMTQMLKNRTWLFGVLLAL